MKHNILMFDYKYETIITKINLKFKNYASFEYFTLIHLSLQICVFHKKNLLSIIWCKSITYIYHNLSLIKYQNKTKRITVYINRF